MKKAAPNRTSVTLLHRFLRFSPDETSRLVRSVLSGEGAAGWTVGVAFVSDGTMRSLHREYLGKRSTTDVLTFVYDRKRKEGDVIVCLDQARRQAPEFGVPYSREVARLVIHGVLHLLGYDDRRAADSRRMKLKEDHYVERSHARTRG